MAENPLTKLPLAGQLGVAAVAAAIVGGGFYYFVYADMVLEEEKTKASLATLVEENRVLQSAANNLPALTQKVKDLEARLEIVKTILPAAKETPDLIKQVQYLATQSNLIVKVFTPGATAQKEFYQEWPISISAEGTYHNLALFFDKVGRLRRLVNVGSLKIRAQSSQKASNTISAQCVATTYVYVEQPPPPPKGAKK